MTNADASQRPVRYELEDGLATITLHHAERGNSLTQDVADGLLDAVRSARADAARVVLLRAEGKAFCVGGDVRTFAASTNLPHEIEDLAETLHRAVNDLMRGDAIVVSAVQGTAAGAGVALAAAADIVLAAESAKFVLAYTRIGLTPDGGSSLLTASLGLHRVLHLALLNPTLTAEDARQAGLVAQVYPDDQFGEGVQLVVAQLLAGSASAQAATKHLIRQTWSPNPETALRREALSIAARAGEPDAREGLSAFVEKRAPEFGR